MAKTIRGRPKARRIFKAEPRSYFGPTADQEVAAAKRKSRKKVRLNETARNSMYAIEQKRKDEAAASLRASRQIALESARRKEAASLLPPPASRTTRKVKKLSPNNDIEAALAEEKLKMEEKAVRNVQRKERLAETKRVFMETQKAKKAASLEKKRLGKERVATRKAKEEHLRLEKKYDLNHLSAGPIEKEHYEELIAKGVPEEEAKKQAKFYANFQADPRQRKLRDPATKWGNFMMNETPPKEEKKPVIKDAIPSIMVSPRKSYAKAIAYKPPRQDYKKLVVLGLPTETGQGLLDLREIKRKVYSALTGKHIFETKPDPVIIGVGKRGKYSELRQGLFRVGPSRADSPNKVYAFATFPTHDQARQVIEAHRIKPITYKGTPLDVRPSRREDEAEIVMIAE